MPYRLIPVLFLVTALSVALAGSADGGGPAEPQARRVTFNHTLVQHAQVPCLLCHRRDTNAAAIRLPGHSPCAGCHAQEFASSTGTLCSVCHVDPASGSLRGFPPLRSFNVRFDHARHDRGSARPREACAACHGAGRRGAGLAIPSGVSAHSTCFVCHQPGSVSRGRDISSCGTCHAIGRYTPTPTAAAAFRVGFSHATHRSEGLTCSDCHTVRSGLRQSRQVTSPVASQHRRLTRTFSCATCHDDVRAFGGDDFSDCKRCHTGATWHF